MPRGVGGKSPSNVMKHLEGVDFPASKDDLLSCARDNNAPDEVMNVLKRLPTERFGGPQDVLQAYGQVE